jgi:transposase
VELVAETAPSCAEQRSPEGSRIEITLAHGHRVTVSGPFDPDAVSRLLRGLSA